MVAIRIKELAGAGCDIRVWSGECERAGQLSGDDKFLSRIFDLLPTLDREVRHDTFPCVCGDYDSLS